MGNIITKTWMDQYDEILINKLNPLSDAKIIHTLTEEPNDWESLLTFTVDNVSHNYKPGDEVRVPDTEAENNYSYYKLDDIINGAAKWRKKGNSNSSVLGKLTVNLAAYINNIKTSDTAVAGVIVSVLKSGNAEAITQTVSSGTSSVIFNNLEPFKDYTVSVSAITNYSTPNSQSISNMSIGYNDSITFSYYADSYNIVINSNQQNDSQNISTARVIYNNISYANGESIKIAQGTALSGVTATDLTSSGYTITSSPDSGVTYGPVIDTTNKTVSVEYSTEILTITSVTDDDNEDVTGQQITVNGITKTYGTDTLTWKIPFGVSDVINAERSGTNVTITKLPNTDVADSVSKTATIKYKQISGVFAYYSDGTLKSINEADSTAIGVAVITNDESVVMDKYHSPTRLCFGGSDKQLYEYAYHFSLYARYDFNGYINTTYIINSLTGYTDNYNIVGAPAAEYCRTRFNGNGYLPALGEAIIINSHIQDVNTVLDTIGGDIIDVEWDPFWTSTIVEDSNKRNIVSWDSTTGGDSEIYAYAFRLLPVSITITLSSTDNTPNANLSVIILDKKTETTQTLTTDSNGQVIATVSSGNIVIRVPGYQMITSNFNVNVNNRHITAEFKTPALGIYAYYSDGTLKGYNDATTDAIGVAVVTSNCSFVIDKKTTNSNNGIYYGGYTKNLSSTAVTTSTQANALLDFAGCQNTINIIAACDGYDDGYAVGSPAASACRAAFGGQGYMGSLGEWSDAYNNKTDVNNMLTKIGGTVIKNNYHWTSTHYNSSASSWFINWGDGTITNRNRNSQQRIRAFMSL